MPLARRAVLLAAAAACSDDAPPSCPIGDRTLPIELAAVAWDGTIAGAADLADGGPVVLRRPLQGGKVVFVGVRARNVDACQAQLTGALRDPTTRQVIALEQRPLRLAAGADGWGHPAAPLEQALANVPACPNAGTARDVDGNPWRLELRVDEAGGRSATIELEVRPRCWDEPGEAAECACECDADFVIGGACPTDDASVRDPDVDAGPR